MEDSEEENNNQEEQEEEQEEEEEHNPFEPVEEEHNPFEPEEYENVVKDVNDEEISEEQHNVYDKFLKRKFPKPTFFLPITAPDNCFIMDVMFISSLLKEDKRTKSVKNKHWLYSNKKRQTKAEVIRVTTDDDFKVRALHDYSPEFISALVFVEITSRKAFVYPMHGKTSQEILARFKDFLRDINFRISKLISDSGAEYSLIKKFLKQPGRNDKYGSKICEYHQVVATQNNHTALSRVDRFIRTLKNIILDYYEEVGGANHGNWVLMLPTIMATYNNTKHKSLYLIGKDTRDPDLAHITQKFYYCPNEVYRNPELRRRIKIKDHLQYYKNYANIDSPEYHIGQWVNYRVTSQYMKYIKHGGFLSLYPAKIVGRTGNRFIIKLKSVEDIREDKKEGKIQDNFNGAEILVPYRDIVPYRGPRKKRSKYNISGIANLSDEVMEAAAEHGEQKRLERERKYNEAQIHPTPEEYAEWERRLTSAAREFEEQQRQQANAEQQLFNEEEFNYELLPPQLEPFSEDEEDDAPPKPYLEPLSEDEEDDAPPKPYLEPLSEDDEEDDFPQRPILEPLSEDDEEDDFPQRPILEPLSDDDDDAFIAPPPPPVINKKRPRELRNLEINSRWITSEPRSKRAHKAPTKYGDFITF